MFRWIVYVFGFSILLAGCFPFGVEEKEAAQEGVPPVRGFWLTNVDSDAMFSPAGLHRAVDLCSALNMNTIYAVTWNNAMTMYPSGIMEGLTGTRIDPRVAGWDPLDTLIRIAHARGIRVIGWFEFGFAASHLDSTGGPILQKNPEWAARDRDGKIASKNGFQWMNPLHPEVQDFVTSLVLEVLDRYEIDGIQGDDRLPAMPSLGGYDPVTAAMYRADHGGQSPPDDFRDRAWTSWRSGKLNDYMEKLHDTIRARHPEAVISMAPSIYPWSKEEYLQDWPAWLRNGWVDEIIPQVYRYDIEKYRTALHEIVENQVSTGNRHMLFPGILLKVGGYLADTAFIAQMIRENRRHGLDGEVFFFYEGLVLREDYFRSIPKPGSIHE